MFPFLYIIAQKKRHYKQMFDFLMKPIDNRMCVRYNKYKHTFGGDHFEEKIFWSINDNTISSTNRILLLT